ncbi:K02A2.6-like [Cordylochernes scorpioides]|uniref:K02A2.6-like n=1 Tax=Cordylochernes scorpioides TaxID=51811 RepID=A0ABY6LU81_9ARAC|nr:K02A2.6-like [Cordylochernes scorpioides]
MVRANRRITLEDIEDGLNEDCSHFSVHKIVSETLGYRKVSASGKAERYCQKKGVSTGEVELRTSLVWPAGKPQEEQREPKMVETRSEICKKLDLFEKNYQERAEKSKALYNGPRSPRPIIKSNEECYVVLKTISEHLQAQAPAPRYYQNTSKPQAPTPRIDEVLDTLQGSKYFSAIDLKSGYWQVEVEEKDKEKTAFTTAHGLYEFNVMPFGLCNAPATFEMNMENMLGILDGKFAYVI